MKFNPSLREPFRLSRLLLEKFVECRRCFYLDCRLGIKRPKDTEFKAGLNTAVDQLLKNEFDYYRKNKEPHPLMLKFGIRGIPFWHKSFDMWLNPFRGMEYYDSAGNFVICGAPDDVWICEGNLSIVDYKATSTTKEHLLESEYWQSYKRQMEIYQWLLARQNTGFPVSNTGYFVYANARRTLPRFDAKLEFEIKIIPYTGSTSWLDPTIQEVYICLNADRLPAPSPDCQYCFYHKKVVEACRQEN